MARSKSKKYDSLRGRETSRFSRRSLPLNLKYTEDRRQFTPEYAPLPKSLRSRDLGLRLKRRIPVSPKPQQGYGYQPPTYNYQNPLVKLEFTQPKDILLCVRRKIRSEVMHALGLAGRKLTFRKSGAGAHNEWSKVGC